MKKNVEFFSNLLSLSEGNNIASLYSMQHCSKNGQNELILSTSKYDPRGKCDYTEVIVDSKNKGGSLYSWPSVPYVEPPVNELRFKKKASKDPWKGVLNATILKAVIDCHLCQEF